MESRGRFLPFCPPAVRKHGPMLDPFWAFPGVGGFPKWRASVAQKMWEQSRCPQGLGEGNKGTQESRAATCRARPRHCCEALTPS